MWRDVEKVYGKIKEKELISKVIGVLSQQAKDYSTWAEESENQEWDYEYIERLYKNEFNRMEECMLSELQKEEILGLISLKQEGAYWDFKKEWYEEGKQPDLLHDIICMSNNLENRDAYIIIGIDEENDYCVNDMTNAENRKSTQMLVDFVRNKKFVGGIRPRVMVETMQLETGTIDIIVIKMDILLLMFWKSRIGG